MADDRRYNLGGANAVRALIVTEEQLPSEDESSDIDDHIFIQMCSIAMPAELMLGHSPPVYSHHLLYRPLVVNPSVGQHIASTRSVPPRIRPCLSTGSILDSIRNDSSSANNDSNNRQKKRVVFADDRGRPLTQVRVMSEPSNVPPLWTSVYLAGVTRGVQAEAASSPWETSFAQPASDYLAFRRKLDQEAVSLENVIVREAEQSLVGTVKVKNLAYDKEVVVRASSDAWLTHEDVHCTYVEQPCVAQAALVLYDTFRFRLTLPVKSEKIEFCVRYGVDNTEYWDNNDGKNFVVQKRQEPRSHAARPEIRRTTSLNGIGMISNGVASLPRESNGVTRIADATRANMRTWSEFASWQHLNNDAPYW